MSSVVKLRNTHNALKRHRGPEDPATLEAAAALRVAQLDAQIDRALAGPPLSEVQRCRLAARILGGLVSNAA